MPNNTHDTAPDARYYNNSTREEQIKLAKASNSFNPNTKMTQKMMSTIMDGYLNCPAVFTTVSLHDVLAAFKDVNLGDIHSINTPNTVTGDLDRNSDVIINFDPPVYPSLGDIADDIRDAVDLANRLN